MDFFKQREKFLDKKDFFTLVKNFSYLSRRFRYDGNKFGTAPRLCDNENNLGCKALFI